MQHSPSDDRPSVVEVLYSFRHGGSEKLGALLAKRFGEIGVRTGVVSLFSGAGPVSEGLERDGIPTAQFGDLILRGRPLPIWFARRLKRFFSRFPRPAIHVHHGLCLGLISPYLRSLNPRSVVLTEHATKELEEMPRYRRNVAAWCQRVDVVTVLHEGMREYFIKALGVPASRVVVVSSGVPEVSPSVAGARTQTRADRPLQLIWVGRMDPDKDLVTLARALAVVVRQTPVPVTLKLVGDGADRRLIETFFREHNLTQFVDFLGYRNDIDKLLLASDVFVFSSRSEGLPLVLLEAMAAGLPCVSTNVGGIPTCIDSSIGRLVPSGDPEALAAAVLELASSKPLREELGRNAKERHRKMFTFDQMTSRYLDVLGVPLTTLAGRTQ